jgi:hypothetical protein
MYKGMDDIERLRETLRTMINTVGMNSVVSDDARSKLNAAIEKYNISTTTKPAEKSPAKAAPAKSSDSDPAAGGRRRRSKSRRQTRRRRTIRK